MASRLTITPELIAMVKDYASTGFSQEEIAVKLGRDRKTLFHNSEGKYQEVVSAYNEGKAEDKKRLLNNMNKLEEAKSEEVQFKTNKYQLAIKHGVVEKTKSEVTGEDGKDLITAVNITIGGKKNGEEANNKGEIG